ncbi:MAG: hypothetical protein HXY20_08730 [Acidobacteria bacterium]|nr:hypothetical protein [Acidobacteriota bacterium]
MTLLMRLSATMSAALAVSILAWGVEDKALFFRENWAESPAEMPISQKHVANQELSLEVWGPGQHGIKKSNHPWIANDPFYVWSGPCPGNWAVSLKHRRSDVDLTGGARIRWRSKQSGFRELRIILRLPDGTWLVSDASEGPSEEWRVREFELGKIRWRVLDISRVTEGKWAASPDLGRVEAVGFTDLMPGGLSDACSRLDWIEVYGRAVAR